LQIPAEDRRILDVFEDEEKAEINRILAYLPCMDIKVEAETLGEEEICQGDIITIRVTLDRLNLKEGEK
jgi:hypothetical protein